LDTFSGFFYVTEVCYYKKHNNINEEFFVRKNIVKRVFVVALAATLIGNSLHFPGYTVQAAAQEINFLTTLKQKLKSSF